MWGGHKKVDPPERGHVRAGLGIGAGVEGGRTRRPSLNLGTATPCSVIGRVRPASGSKDSAKFFRVMSQRLRYVARSQGRYGDGQSGGDRGGPYRPGLG